jgi:NADH-quinone oxidoreductase subunit M
MRYLTLSILIPIVAGVLVLALGRADRLALVKNLALVGALAGFAITIPLYTQFNLATGAMQFEELSRWVASYNINYHLGVDGISVLFVLLNSFTTILVIWAGWVVVDKRPAQYYAAFLIQSGLINGVFCALDGVLFYFFFEAMLIPMYLIIGGWGGPNRVYAAIKFFLYTMLGLGADAGRAAVPVQRQRRQLRDPRLVQPAAVAQGPALALRRVLPCVRGQGPDVAGAHVAARRARRGADRRLGGAGRDHAEDRRVRLPALHPADRPDASRTLSGFVIALSLIAVVYIGLVALVQKDMKKLIAYSSISHMGFVTLGFFLFSQLGIEGGLAQMISHGFVSAAMFLCVGVLYDRMHSRMISDYGGVVNTMPRFAALFMLFAMANSGLPGHQRLRRRVHGDPRRGEGQLLAGLRGAVTLILGAAYTLWMAKRVIFGKVANQHVAELTDVSAREFWLLAVVGLAVLGDGSSIRSRSPTSCTSRCSTCWRTWRGASCDSVEFNLYPVLPEDLLLTAVSLLLSSILFISDGTGTSPTG